MSVAILVRTHTVALSFGSVLFILGASAAADPPKAQMRAVGDMVVIATVEGGLVGRREALRAAKRLGSAIAMDTLNKVPQERRYMGHTVTLHASPGGKVVVSSYFGDNGADALEEARKHFPQAMIVRTPLPEDGGEPWEGSPYYPASILVVGSNRSYQSAVRTAKHFSKASGIPYDTQGMVFDKKRGLIWPDDFPDDAIFAGQYSPRRYDTCGGPGGGPCVTVERSEAYEGFRPGLYIVVAGIVDRDVDDGLPRLEAARKIVPSAYIKDTVLYVGCLH